MEQNLRTILSDTVDLCATDFDILSIPSAHMNITYTDIPSHPHWHLVPIHCTVNLRCRSIQAFQYYCWYIFRMSRFVHLYVKNLTLSYIEWLFHWKAQSIFIINLSPSLLRSFTPSLRIYFWFLCKSYINFTTHFHATYRLLMCIYAYICSRREFFAPKKFIPIHIFWESKLFIRNDPSAICIQCTSRWV